MKKYIPALFVLTIFFTPSLYSKEVTSEAAKTIALNFLTKRNVDITTSHLNNPIIKHKEGISFYYVFNFENGFIIVSADNSVFPVLGYSFESNFNENKFPPAFSFWMNQVKEQILYNITMQAQPTENITKAWDKYSFENFVPAKIEDGVSPLINTTWNQDNYYNSSFPIDSGFQSNHPYAGCVAVVISQIMKYYNWPKTGAGQNTIVSPYGDLTANFGNTSYNWIGMESNLNSENPSVAELIYHSAIAVNSEFYPQGTGAFDYNIPPALVNFFRYKETAQFILRDGYLGDWEELIRNELDNGRPVVYGGADPPAGHTFICDGYQDNSFFHFNWGWGGAFNGYYYLDSLIAGGYHFDYQHDVVVGIEPDIEGGIILFPPKNLSSQVEMRDVTLTWQAPTGTSSLELLGYNVFRNDTLLNKSILTTTGFTNLDAPPGNHVYRVNTSFIGAGTGPGIEIETFVSSVKEQFASPVSIFPNPTKGKLWITANPSAQSSALSVYNISGKELMNIPLQNTISEQAVDLSELNKGVYCLTIKSGKLVFVEKLIIY